MLKQKFCSIAGDFAEGRTEDCGETCKRWRALSRASGFTAVADAIHHLLQWTWYKLAIASPGQQH
jgi:hypothetical protein